MVHTFKLYLLLIKWQLLNMKAYLPIIVLVQIIIGVGVVYGLGFMYPDIDSLSAKYITTGATMMSLATLGLALVPQSIAQMKANKTFDYLWSLPVPRLVFLLSDFTLWTAVVLPGVLLALVFGSLKYGFELSISPLAFPGELPDRPPARRSLPYSHGVAGQVHGRAGARDGHDGSGRQPGARVRRGWRMVRDQRAGPDQGRHEACIEPIPLAGEICWLATSP